MKLTIEPSVCVITPTIGQKTLTQCTESVANQTYGNLTHLIVCDGPDAFQKLTHGFDKAKITIAPYNTGKNGFYGHRIYASYPHLVDHDYIFFLDEDNWYAPDHVESLVNLLEINKLHWAYSLRKVYTRGLRGDEFLADDCCEAIGKWPIYFTADAPEPQHLVDTSCYAFRRDTLIRVCQHWHYGWGGDRRFFHIIKDSFSYNTTGKHTLNYRLPDMNKAYGGDLDFFKRGNEFMLNRYNGAYPWQTSLNSSTN